MSSRRRCATSARKFRVSGDSPRRSPPRARSRAWSPPSPRAGAAPPAAPARSAEQLLERAELLRHRLGPPRLAGERVERPGVAARDRRVLLHAGSMRARASRTSRWWSSSLRLFRTAARRSGSPARPPRRAARRARAGPPARSGPGRASTSRAASCRASALSRSRSSAASRSARSRSAWASACAVRIRSSIAPSWRCAVLAGRLRLRELLLDGRRPAFERRRGAGGT